MKRMNSIPFVRSCVILSPVLLHPQNRQRCNQGTSRKQMEDIKQRVGEFFDRLVNGCGDSSCTSPHCLEKVRREGGTALTREQAAVEAIALAHRAGLQVCKKVQKQYKQRRKKERERKKKR